MKPLHDTHFPLVDITCMDPNRPPLVPEKLCKTLRLIGYVIQNGVSKSKVIHDMVDVMKRGKNIGKALNHVVVRHHQALTCRPRDAHVSFVSPFDYQFSCSGTPPRRKLSPPSARRSPSHRAVRLCRGAGSDGIIDRRVKITGSMLNDDVSEKDFHVDEAAEEFISRFYRELRVQRWLDHYC
ncbi:hypothetical protein VNO78_01145 [Psophocarpus tetragonolobus]|uniref:Uncharacterized protein n=1 Tax=Psophocarpus tetragonolobus TaxID=3891 RepID=A0AAN9SZ80_PSOTE